MPSSIDLNDAALVGAVLRDAAAALLASGLRSGSAHRLPGRGRLLVTGDLHDHPIHLAKILRLARLDGSAGNHLVLHELIHGERLINGIDFSYRMLARVAALVLEHPGQVHPMLANHELAQLTGRGVSKGAGNSVELFEQGLQYVFADGWPDVADAVRAFIAALPVAVVSESGVLCAHSLPSAATMRLFDPGVLERPLVEADYLGPSGAAYLMVWGRRYTDQSVQTLAARWGVRLFCLGHEHVETGIEAAGPLVIVLNSDHEQARVVAIDLADVPSPEEAVMASVPLSAVPES